MRNRLTIRNRLILTVGLPLFVIAILAAIAVPTFQTVKVNGPQYDKIASAKTLEADILPPPAYQIEAHLTARLLLDAKNAEEVGRYEAKLASLKAEFDARHQLWQGTLGSDDPMRASMKRAFDAGAKYFALLNSSVLPKATTKLTDESVRAELQTVFVDELSPLYEEHRKAIDETVSLSRARQTELENETSSLISSRFLILGGAAGISMIALLVLGSLVARSISRPVTALTEAATRAAETELPRVVHAVQNDPNAVASMPRSTMADGTDELGALARAFESMQDTALRLATDQARVRRNVSDNLVNVGRRNQSLLKRTLASLSKMEQEERDSTKLENLFRLDHLSTRMRRNADSLLVLAGAESPRTWTQPAAITDVVRAAIAQIEAYDRVEIGRLESVRIKGAAIADLAHLIAELLENATYFSPPSTNVSVSGKLRMDGYLLVISDDGVGMTPEELAAANERLSNPQAFEAEPAKVLGLIVVGHLASRLGLTVRLTESVTRGVACQIQMPDAFVEVASPVEPAPKNVVSPFADMPDAPQHPSGKNGLPQRRTPDTPAPVADVPQRISAAPSPFETAPPAPRLRPIGEPAPGSLASRVAAIPDRAVAPVRSAPPTAAPSRVAPGALPTRVRGANFAPGAPAPVADAAPTERSVSDMRSSLTSLQRGVNAGRARTETGEFEGTKTPTSDAPLGTDTN